MKKYYFLVSAIIVLSVSIISCTDESTNPEDETAPTVSITAPSNDAVFEEGQAVNFVGTGEDNEGNELSQNLLIWTSDKDGAIGTGTAFSRDDLSVNTHAITLVGVDDNGNSDTAQVAIEISAASNTDQYGLLTVPAHIGYSMGWDGIQTNETPVHTVTLDEMKIGKFEVTYALWSEVKTWAEANGYQFSNAGSQGGCLNEPCNTTIQHPVTNINWRDCIAWCNAYSEKEGLSPVYFSNTDKTEVYRDSYLGDDIGNDFVAWTGNGFRLPTEAEWEHAARFMDLINISSGAEHSGSNLNSNIAQCVWNEDNAASGTRPVGQLQGNSLGAFDMSGNVWEWCWDEFGTYPTNLQDNPHGPDTNVFASNIYRVHRGGSWHNSATYCRAATRDFSGRNSTSEEIYTGFRIARSGLTP